MAELTEEKSGEKRRDFITVIFDFVIEGGGMVFLLLAVSGAAQVCRDAVFQVQKRSVFAKLGNDFCSPVIWSAYKEVDKDTFKVALFALIIIYGLNWKYFNGKRSSRQKQTFGQFLLMVIGYDAFVNFIHYFKAQNFLHFALTKCSLPLGQKEMEGAMLAGSYDFLWLIILVSVVFIVVTFFFFWRRIPNPDSLDKG